MGEKASLRDRSDQEPHAVDGPEPKGSEPQPVDVLNFYSDVQIGLCHLDLDLRYVQINKWLAAANGLSVSEHIGRTIAEVLPDVARGIEKQLRRVITTGEPVESFDSFTGTSGIYWQSLSSSNSCGMNRIPPNCN